MATASDEIDELSENVLNIIERNPDFLKKNLEDHMAILQEAYTISKSKDKPTVFFWRKKGDEKIRQELEEKSSSFEGYFRNNVFNKLIHVSNYAVDTEEVELKAPSLLGSAIHSGDLDWKIGNTNYVFFAAERLRSNSARIGTVEYTTKSRDCYVVPMDIAHIHIETLKENEQLLKTYAENIYTYEGFIKFYSTYCAILFEKPEEAIEFFSSHAYYPDLANSWTPESYELMDEKEAKIMEKMSYLFIEHGIIPPISPEFQFKDSVIATVLNK